MESRKNGNGFMNLDWGGGGGGRGSYYSVRRLIVRINVWNGRSGTWNLGSGVVGGAWFGIWRAGSRRILALSGGSALGLRRMS
jgi:hypothetical protein